jgi:protein-S-isoprenylcysteine O-methyltransferase Ste14
MSDPRLEPDLPPPADNETGAHPGFLPTAPRRANVESVVVRLIATAGVIGIGTAIGAIMSSSGATGWIIALVVSLVSVVLAALLWRSRRL